jgi:hypothetical protein
MPAGGLEFAWGGWTELKVDVVPSLWQKSRKDGGQEISGWFISAR